MLPINVFIDILYTDLGKFFYKVIILSTRIDLQASIKLIFMIYVDINVIKDWE